jgi:hypothetical protein
MSQEEIDRIYRESLIKEMKVMESVRRICTLDFSVFFGCHEYPVHESFDPNPRMAKLVQSHIDTWIDSLVDKLLIPQVSPKTISRASAAELKRTVPLYELHDEEIGVTAFDLERVRHEHGYEIEGPCEMRQKWYSSNLKPRTYYAQGGTAHHSSKHLAVPFVELCDLLPCTNRRARVDPSRIVIRDPSSDVVYYDLTSFTSNLHVQREFMFHLARYCEGVKTLILDARLGVKEVDLGDLIYRYTRANLCEPTYTLPEKYGNPTEVHYHSVAGFLGVYGNIATATFIHGIVMSMAHAHTDENNVAGDDGLVVTKDPPITLKRLSTLGETSDEKTFHESEGACIHLKRPITRIGDRLYQGQLTNWPSLEQGQTEVDPRYPYMKGMPDHERRSATASSVTAFLRSLEHMELDSGEREMVDKHLTYVYEEYRLPREGCVPQVRTTALGFVPAYEERFIGIDPITNTIDRHYSGMARVPYREKVRLEGYMLDEQQFRCNQCRLLRYLEILGYLEQKKVDVLMFGEEGHDRLITEYVSPEPRVYDYLVLRQLPEWARSVMCL